MARKTARTRKKKAVPSQRKFNPNAAGIDLGATVHYVAVPAERDPQPVRHFGTLTEDLEALADWLKACEITTVAMEATGVYWIPLFQILEDRGFEVYLVNARRVKNVPGRKTDVQDCQWLQYLHSVGLLNASFRPLASICAVRSLRRHRESLMRSGCQHLLRVQKALDQMNVQLHHAVTDITGVTGLAILDAIVAGERDPKVLASHRNYPLLLVGGKRMGFKHGQYLDYAGAGAYRGGWAPGDTEPWRMNAANEDLSLSNLYVTMLQGLGVETETFANNTGTISEV